MTGKAHKREEIRQLLDRIAEERGKKEVSVPWVMAQADVSATYARDNMRAYAIKHDLRYSDGVLYFS